MRWWLSGLLFVSALVAVGCGSDGGADHGGGEGGEAQDVDPSLYLRPPKSCAYECSGCDENETPYQCPAMQPWNQLPHLEACAGWDEKYPDVVQGKCKASAPSGAAVRLPGPDAEHPGDFYLPDGRLLRPAGEVWTFSEKDIRGGQTVSIIPVPDTTFVLTVDTGNLDQTVRCIDSSKIGAGDPVVGHVTFEKPDWLNAGIVAVSSQLAYVATAFGVVQALHIDSTGALSRQDDASIALPESKNTKGQVVAWYASSLAVSPDSSKLVVSGVKEKDLLVYDIDPKSEHYRELLGRGDLGFAETFSVAFDPHDTTGARVYVTGWGDSKVAEVDLSDPSAPKVVRSFETDRDPQGLAFLDERWMAVANDLGETISLIDRAAGSVTPVAVAVPSGLRGLDLSTLTYDETSGRLYATLSGINAVRVFRVQKGDGTQPPKLAPLGDIPTAWWPTGTVVHEDGSLTIASMRGFGIGPLPVAFDIEGSDGNALMRGSVQQVPKPDEQQLEQWQKQVLDALRVDELPGAPKVSCPDGAADFPIPTTNTQGRSPVIEHVFLIVRENKTFDALLGDLPGVRGDPELTMKTSSEQMDQIWTNFRALARTFTVADNFYNAAVQSTQGHTWTTYGRTTDFDERTWSADAREVPLSGISFVGRPVEGSLFEWLIDNQVGQDIWGEVVGSPKNVPKGERNPVDGRYPGGPFQNIGYNDLMKACYLAARLRVTCDAHEVAYITLPNDHTMGLHEGNPTPETMCAVNDEATGMFVDALSHSPFWASSLVIITEDDPQQGGEHIDYHRTPFVMVSPWVKRGYVTHTHMDAPSIHKLIAHIFGLPYLNLNVAHAPLPLDAFTSTPDFTPYEFTHRTWKAECPKNVTRAESRLTESWDFEDVDEQPGLGQQVMRWMRGVQLNQLSVRQQEDIRRRLRLESRESDDAGD